MKKITFTLRGASPLSWSKVIDVQKETGEASDAFEQRIWRLRFHTDEKGNIVIPGNAIKGALEKVAAYLGETVPGKGKATYTKHYCAGLLVPDAIPIGVHISGAKAEGVYPPCHIDSVKSERVYVPSDGKPGGAKRVWKTFPFVPAGWEGTGVIYVLDPLLESCTDTIRRHLEHAGKFIGLGRFRPINRGFYGRFTVESFVVTNEV